MFRDMSGSMALGAGLIGVGIQALPTAIVGHFPGNRTYPFDQVSRVIIIAPDSALP